ncbi:MAG: hypothetical protein ACK521_10455 [bacterium]
MINVSSASRLPQQIREKKSDMHKITIMADGHMKRMHSKGVSTPLAVY